MPKTIKLTPMKVRKPDGSFKDIDAIGGAGDGAESVINDTNRDSTTKYPSVKAAADYADRVVDDIPYRSSVDYENPVTVLDTVTLPIHPEYNTPGDETSGIKYYVNDDQSILGGITLEYGKEYHVIFNGDTYKCYTYPYYTGAITPGNAWSTVRSLCIGSPKFYSDRNSQYSHPFSFAKLYDFDTSGSSVTYTSRNAFMVYPVAENQVDITAASVSIVKYAIDVKSVDPVLMHDQNGAAFNPMSVHDGVLEPYAASATVRASHAEGAGSNATATAAHAEGIFTNSGGYASHAEGVFTTASGNETHAEGLSTVASGTAGHAEGCGSRATASYSHASGWYSYARGYASTATGYNTDALGRYSFTSGVQSAANNDAAAAIGCGTRADSPYQFASGKYNARDFFTKYAHIIGNGTDDYTRSNAYTLDWEGNGWFAGDVYVHSNSGTNQDAGSKRLVTEDDISDKMERYIIRLVTDGETYSITNYETGADISFDDLTAAIRDTSKYVVCVYGNSKLRPQYISSSEIVFTGLNRDASGADALRMIVRPTGVQYDSFAIASESVVNEIKEDLTQKYEKPESGIPATDLADGVIPTKLPVPNKLTFTGAVTGEFDGSNPLTVNIPSGGGGGGGSAVETVKLYEGQLSDGSNIVLNGLEEFDFDGLVIIIQLSSNTTAGVFHFYNDVISSHEAKKIGLSVSHRAGSTSTSGSTTIIRKMSMEPSWLSVSSGRNAEYVALAPSSLHNRQTIINQSSDKITPLKNLCIKQPSVCEGSIVIYGQKGETVRW